MRRRDRRQSGFDIADILCDFTTGGTFSFWVYGIVCSGVIALYGATCVVTQSASFIGRRPARIIEYSGNQAVALGLSYIAVATFMHCHFCWSEHEKYHGYAAIGKVVSLIGGIAGMVFLIFDAIVIS